MKARLKNPVLLPAIIAALGLLLAGGFDQARALTGADLSLSASVAPEPVGVGSNLVYSLTVSNAGPSVATDVVISNQLPAGLGFVSGTGFLSYSNGVTLVNFASLAVGATGSVQVVEVVQSAAAGELTNLFQVSANEPDPVPANNTAAVVSTVTNGAVAAVPLPGTPTAGWNNNPGGPTVVISEGGGSGAQPLTYNSSPLPVTSGSVVFLIDANGGNNYTNWRAVVNFYNAVNVTGSQVVTATNYLTFFQTNSSPLQFANFPLFTNAVFVPISATNADGSVTANLDVFGPVGGINAGQEAVITVTAAVQPSPGPPIVSITLPTAGQQFGNVQEFEVEGYWEQSFSSEAAVTSISVQLNGSAPVSAIVSAAEDIPVFYTVDPLTPIPGSNTVSAEIVDSLGNASTNTVTFDYAPFTGGTNTLGIPGTPSTIWNNPGSASVTIPEGGGIGVQSIITFILSHTVLAGDVVMLINTNNGNSYTNWKAVVEFFNPDDPAGTKGLAATEYQTFYQTNASSNYFANFKLMPNVVYTPVTATNDDGSVTANIDVYGPAGGVLSGQLAILNITAAVQPDPFALAITSPATGQNVSSASFTVTGTTTNGIAPVSNVFVQLNGGVWTGATTANGWTNWSAAVTFAPGLNTLQAYAVDILGNVTPTNTVALEYATDASGVADVSVSGTAGPLSGTFGTNLVYFLTVSNAGPATATGVEVSDQLPASVAFISATGGATPTNGLLVVNIGSLAAGATNLVQVTVQPTSSSIISLTNVVQAFASQSDPDLTNNSAVIASELFTDTGSTISVAEYDTTYTTNVSQQVTNFSTEIMAKLPNGTVLYDQTFSAPYSDPTVQAAVAQAAEDLTNAGATSYTGPTQTGNSQTLVGISTITVPSSTNDNFIVRVKTWIGPTTLLLGDFGVVQGYSFDSIFIYPVGWNGNPATLSIVPGAQEIETFILSLVTNTFTTTITSNYLNSSVYELDGMVSQADVSLNVSAAPNPVGVGSNLVYSITVSNAGLDAATGVVISNQLPAGVNFVSATGGATPSGGALLMNLGSLAVGATNSVQVVVQPTAAGSLTNTFQVFANEFDPNVTNNSVAVISTVTNALVVYGGIPGSPLFPWVNPGGAVIYTYAFVSGLGPIEVGGSNGGPPVPATNCQAGDIVFLMNPSGTDDPTNWGAVARFFNPADPTGTNNLPATLSQSFFSTNYGGIGFAGFQLLPDVAFYSNTFETNNGIINVDEVIIITGPSGAVLPGQEDIYTVGVAAPHTDLSLTASATPEPVGVGNNLVYSLTVSNSPSTLLTIPVWRAYTNVFSATGVVISNRIPAGVNFVSATGGATPTNGVLLINVGLLAQSATDVVQVVVQPTSPGKITNSFAIFGNEPDPNVTNNSAAVVSTVTNAPVVYPSLPGTPLAWANPGGTLVVTYSYVSGLGPIQVGGLHGVTNIPATNCQAGDLVFLSDLNGGNDPTNWGAVARFFNPSDPAGTNNLPATMSQVFFSTNYGGSGFAGFQLFPDVAFTTGGGFVTTNGVTTVNTTFIQFGPAGGILSGQEDVYDVVVATPNTDLSLSASAAPEPVAAGNNLVYSLTISNSPSTRIGTSVFSNEWTATGVVISNRIPAGVNFVSATGGATPTNGVLLLNLGALGPGATDAVQVVVQPAAAGKVTNLFQVFADEADPAPANNSATVVSTVTNAPATGADLSLSVNTAYAGFEVVEVMNNGFVDGPYPPTNLLVYSVTVSNAGPETATGVVVSNQIQIPTSIDFVSATGGATPNNGVLMVNVGTLAVGATNLVQIVLRPTIQSIGWFTNIFAVSADEADPVPANNYATAISGIFTPIPGEPLYYNPGGPVVIGGSRVSGPGPIDLNLVGHSQPYCQAGDLVLLADPNGSHDPTNWAAVARFFNPADPTGTNDPTGINDLEATESEAFFSTNYGGRGFAGFQLLPAAAFIGEGTVTTTNGVTTFSTTYVVFGPAGIILSGQEEIHVVNLATPFSDLSLSASASPEPVAAGSNLVYSLTVSNAATSVITDTFGTAFSNILNAADVVISNQIPAGVNFVSATGGATPTNGVLLINLGALGPGATDAVQVVVQPATAGKVTNLFAVFADQADPAPANNSAAVVSTVTNGVNNTSTTSSAEYDTTNTTTVSLQVTNYSTELIARMPDGTVVYDQTFSNAFSDATVQAAITTAAGDLTGAGAASYTGPTQTSFLETTNSSSVTVPTGTNTGFIVGTKVFNGPQTILVGDFGMISGYSLVADETGQTNYTVPTGWNGNPTSLPIVPGGEDIDTFVLSLVTNNLATTITDTNLNSSVYVMTGIVAQVDVALSITAAPNPVGVGAPLTYSLTVTNNSSTTATGVVVTNTLPPNVTLFSLLPGEGSASNHAGVVTYTVGSLPNGIADTLAIVVIPNAAGQLTNIAEAFSAQTDSQPTNNTVTNVTTAVTVPFTNLVLTVLSEITLNPQTGLFEQRIEVSNGGPSTPSSVMVLISGLPANAKLYNATGTTNGVPFVQSAAPLGVGSNVVFLLEFYVPTRVPPAGLTLTVQAGPPVIPPVVAGIILNISRTVVLSDGSVLVEFTAVPGQVYAIQYSSDMVTWLTAVPAITASENEVQWIDSGPPKTASSPAQQGARYYRVVLLSAK